MDKIIKEGITFDDVLLVPNYSEVLPKDVDICTYVDLEKNKTIKGDYIINVYNEFSKIGTAIFNHN